MRNLVHPRTARRLASIPARAWAALTLAVLLAACGSDSNDAAVATPATSPTAPTTAPTTTPNTVVVSSTEPAEVQLFAGQSRLVTLSFRTSDGGTADDFVLAAPSAGLPAGWTIGSSRCVQVEASGQCQVALTYAPSAAEPSSVITFPFSYRNNTGEASAGSVALRYRALAANAAVATADPAGAIRGLVGKASAVTLSFTTNDASAAAELHLDSNLSALPAGWTSASAGLDCPSFSTGSSCQLHLSYAPAAAAPASALALNYRYRDSSGKLQTATASIGYSATAPNTVSATASPAGLVRARPGASQQVALAFLPSDNGAASNLRLASDPASLPPEWKVSVSKLPCAQVNADGGCTLTLVYTPGANQPAGKLALNFAYTDAVGRELAGDTVLAYASRDYKVYVSNYGVASAGFLAGGVRQCELDSAGKLAGCVLADGTWPRFGANNVVVHGARAYIGVYSEGGSAEPVTSCRIADDNALVDCADSGVVFDRLTNLDVNQLGAFVLAVPAAPALPIPHLTRCALGSDGGLDGNSCRIVDPKTFDLRILTAMISANDMVYVSASNFSTVQTLYSCALADDGLKCSVFGLGAPQQIIQRMSRGQAGEQAYLYLAGTSRTDPQKAPGAIFKCALDADGLVSGCDRAARPQGIAPDDMIRISDIRIVGTTAYLITGRPDTDRKIYRCPVDQKSGDLPACVSAGDIEGMDPSSIAVR